MRIGIEHPDIHFEVVYGVSDNARSWYDNSNAFRLGYRPQDRSEDYAREATETDATVSLDLAAEQFQGGSFCGMEYDGDVERTT
jgi:uronate dehydrogenase